MNVHPPRNWYEVLDGINTETFGMYSEETARVAIECCMNALEDYEAGLPEDQIDRVGVFGISDAESIQIASTDAVNGALTLHHQRTTVATTIRLVDAIAKEVARMMGEKREHRKPIDVNHSGCYNLFIDKANGAHDDTND